MFDILYIASQSEGRHHLLRSAQIPFKVLVHNSDEQVARYQGNVQDFVLSVARDKMNSLELPCPPYDEKNTMFVLTADTLVYDKHTDEFLGKPKNYEDAVRMLKLHQKYDMLVITACVLHHKEYKNNEWLTVDKREWTTQADVLFRVPDDEIDLYLQRCPGAYQSAGAGIMDEFGTNYFASVNGSYTTVVGLPVYELRKALKDMKFVLK